jgi:hypothetical protein
MVNFDLPKVREDLPQCVFGPSDPVNANVMAADLPTSYVLLMSSHHSPHSPYLKLLVV